MCLFGFLVEGRLADLTWGKRRAPDEDFALTQTSGVAAARQESRGEESRRPKEDMLDGGIFFSS